MPRLETWSNPFYDDALELERETSMTRNQIEIAWSHVLDKWASTESGLNVFCAVCMAAEKHGSGVGGVLDFYTCAQMLEGVEPCESES